MLYDTRWDKPEVKADPFSLEAFANWLATKDPTESYDWLDVQNCAVAQFLRPQVRDFLHCGTETYSYWKHRFLWIIPHGFARGRFPKALTDVAAPEPRTFGAALSRARALASKG